jgi:dTDP-4-amino-4,6-dideoxygalactose transaminase
MIPVLIPDMPSADELLPYLRRIDEAKWYSNGGPLVRELEQKLGGVTVSSATLGLELAAKVIFKKKRVRIPAFTFHATATALLRAGFEPVLCDVDENWTLKDIGEQSLPVCPFGAAVAPGPLVDAAGAWGNQHVGNRVFSLHATKSLPAGEGGVVCGDEELVSRVRRLASFGMDRGVVVESGTNAKLSEYHAAVALASLTRWEASKAKRFILTAAYFKNLPEVGTQFHGGARTIFPILVPNASAIAQDMAAAGIETRRWYIPTLERHPAFKNLPVEGALKNCRRLNDEILCLPFHTSLSVVDVERVCEVLQWAITKNAKATSSTGLRTSSGRLKLVPAHGLTHS